MARTPLGANAFSEHVGAVRRFAFFAGLALSAMRRSLGVTTLTVVTISTALAILATFGVALMELQRLSIRVGSQLAISAYLEDGFQGHTALSAAVRDWEAVQAVDHLTSAEALKAFRAQLGPESVVLEGLPDTVLPSSLEITLRPAFRTVDHARSVADRLAELPGVGDVQYGERRLRRLQVVSRFAQVACAILGAALLLATVLIVANTVRLTVFARRDEIEVMTLVGATGPFVRAPFLLEGLFQGALGGLFALGWLGLLDGALRSGFRRLMEPTFGEVAVQVHWLELTVPLMASGAVLGLVGSGFAVGRFLRML